MDIPNLLAGVIRMKMLHELVGEHRVHGFRCKRDCDAIADDYLHLSRWNFSADTSTA
jgi:hypothetical protein